MIEDNFFQLELGTAQSVDNYLAPIAKEEDEWHQYLWQL